MDTQSSDNLGLLCLLRYFVTKRRKHVDRNVAKTTLTVLFSHVLSDFDAISASGRLGDVCQPACGQGPVDALGYCIHLSGFARSRQNVAGSSFEAASTMLVRLLGSWPGLDS